MKITEALLAEHIVFHHLFDLIEQQAAASRRLAEVQALGALLRAALGTHSQAEQDLLFQPLEHCIDQIGHHESFCEEHEQILSELKRIGTVTRLKSARQILQQVVRLAREHCDKEERILFPLAEELLSKTTLLALGDAWEQARLGRQSKGPAKHLAIPA